jgi:hypothetical protein
MSGSKSNDAAADRRSPEKFNASFGKSEAISPPISQWLQVTVCNLELTNANFDTHI